MTNTPNLDDIFNMKMRNKKKREFEYQKPETYKFINNGSRKENAAQLRRFLFAVEFNIQSFDGKTRVPDKKEFRALATKLGQVGPQKLFEDIQADNKVIQEEFKRQVEEEIAKSDDSVKNKRAREFMKARPDFFNKENVNNADSK